MPTNQQQDNNQQPTQQQLSNNQHTTAKHQDNKQQVNQNKEPTNTYKQTSDGQTYPSAWPSISKI